MKKFSNLLIIIGLLLILVPLIYVAFVSHWAIGIAVLGFIMFCIGGFSMPKE